MRVHPSLFEIMERERKLLKSKGIKASQTDISAMIAKRLQNPRKLNKGELFKYEKPCKKQKR